ncbi:MAG: hypothetical protein K2X27_04230 [Candidatus Obscuribacterales bacterium]|nr:hypothetical protein [Candidatus Obscuribacterales bacterium]
MARDEKLVDDPKELEESDANEQDAYKLADEYVAIADSKSSTSVASKDSGLPKSDATQSSRELERLLDTAEKQSGSGIYERFVKQLAESCPDACSRRDAAYMGESAALFGFDKNTGTAVFAKSAGQSLGESREFKQVDGRVSDENGRNYQELDLGFAKLYKDGNGSLFMKGEENGKAVLQELPALKELSPSDERLSISKSDEGVKGKQGVGSDLQALPPGEQPIKLLDLLEEAAENANSGISAKAIVQSNDYARNHVLTDKIQDGFRSAGQFREFAPDGSFNASDRAATVVDRSRDSKLNELIEDARKQFADLPPRDRAVALAEYVNKIMGPPDGDEKALDARYRQIMKENAGKEKLLSEFMGNGACAQRALMFKVLADELGLESSIVRGNGGAHVWNTVKLDGKEEVFDARARVYGNADAAAYRPLQSSQDTVNGRDFVAGQRISAEGKDWTVQGYDSTTGGIKLKRSEEVKADATELAKQNPGKELEIGAKYNLKSADGKVQEWTLAGKNADGSLKLERVEEKTMARKELAESVLEMAVPKNADVKHLEDNWKTLVGDNSKLDDKQKESLRSALETLDKSGNSTRSAEFRRLIEAMSELAKANGPEAQARVEALSKIAKTIANYPKGIFPPIDRLITAENLEGLKAAADSMAQAAKHKENPPLDMTGKPAKDGHGYEHAASQALQHALNDPAALTKAIREGKLPPGNWVFVPSAGGSTADNLKIDGQLIDLKTGKTVFLDFAMHEPGQGANQYRTLNSAEDPAIANSKDGKLRKTWNNGQSRYPGSLTLDEGSMGWDKSTGNADPSKVKSTEVLERLGAMLKGEQIQHIIDSQSTPAMREAVRQRFEGCSQSAPRQFDIAGLRSRLGGELFNFAPVATPTEAALMSEESGKPVKTTDQEVTEISDKFRRSGDAGLYHLGQSAEAARHSTVEQVSASTFFEQSTRAAVELDKFNARDALYGKGKMPKLDFDLQLGGRGSENGLPRQYENRSYVGMTGDDRSGARPTEVRIYDNGDILVRTTRNDNGNVSRDFKVVGNVRDLKGDLARELQKYGLNSPSHTALIKAFGDLADPVKFNQMTRDLQDARAGRMSEADFWSKHPEMLLMADGVQNGEAASRAATDMRPFAETRAKVDADPELSKLSNAEKDAIANKYLELKDLSKDFRKFSMKDVQTVIELEKGGLSTEAAGEAVQMKRSLRKDAETWNASELRSNYDSAKAAQARDLATVKDLAEVHRIRTLQSQLKVDAATAQGLHAVRKNYLPDATIADLEAVNKMHGDMKAAGLSAVTIQESGRIYSKAGALSSAEISEMARIRSALPRLKAEELAGMAVRNVQVESLYGADKAKADEIRAKAEELAKNGKPLESVHDAAALMVLDGKSEAKALELAPAISELRGRHNFAGFSELANTAGLLQSIRQAAGDNIKADFEKMVFDGIKAHGSDLSKLKNHILDAILLTPEGPQSADWEKLYDRVESCKTEADLARLFNLPADAAAQKAALEAYRKAFQSDVAAAVEAPPAMNLTDVERRGLDLAKDLRKGDFAALSLTNRAEVGEFLKSCLDQIDELKGDKKWTEADRRAFESLVEKYRSGDAAAMATIHAYLDLKIPVAAASATPGAATGMERPAAAPESVTLADLERKLRDPVERATVLKRLEDEGHLRETLKKAGMPETRARELERDLLSEKEEVRERARREIERYYESRGRGGFRGFAKEASGRLGAMVMVAAVVLPWLLSSPASAGDYRPSATWSGGGRR